MGPLLAVFFLGFFFLILQFSRAFGGAPIRRFFSIIFTIRVLMESASVLSRASAPAHVIPWGPSRVSSTLHRSNKSAKISSNLSDFPKSSRVSYNLSSSLPPCTPLLSYPCSLYLSVGSCHSYGKTSRKFLNLSKSSRDSNQSRSHSTTCNTLRNSTLPLLAHVSNIFGLKSHVVCCYCHSYRGSSRNLGNYSKSFRVFSHSHSQSPDNNKISSNLLSSRRASIPLISNLSSLNSSIVLCHYKTASKLSNSRFLSSKRNPNLGGGARRATFCRALLFHEAQLWNSIQPQIEGVYQYSFLLYSLILIPLFASIEEESWRAGPGCRRTQQLFGDSTNSIVTHLRQLFSSCQLQGLQRGVVQMLTVLVLANAFYSDIVAPDPYDTLENVPQDLSGGDKRKKIQKPKSRKAEGCTQKCVGTCIRGGAGSPGEGPFNVRRPLVVFKEGFRSRQYCLIECSDICNLIGDGDDGP